MGSNSALDKTKHFHWRGQEPRERARTRVRAACEQANDEARSERAREVTSPCQRSAVTGFCSTWTPSNTKVLPCQSPNPRNITWKSPNSLRIRTFFSFARLWDSHSPSPPSFSPSFYLYPISLFDDLIACFIALSCRWWEYETEGSHFPVTPSSAHAPRDPKVANHFASLILWDVWSIAVMRERERKNDFFKNNCDCFQKIVRVIALVLSTAAITKSVIYQFFSLFSFFLFFSFG